MHTFNEFLNRNILFKRKLLDSNFTTKRKKEREVNTHSARGVRATVKGGMGVLPWSPGVNAGDSSINVSEKTEQSSNNAEHRSDSHIFHTEVCIQCEKREDREREMREMEKGFCS